jgi:hypothetical protein
MAYKKRTVYMGERPGDLDLALWDWFLDRWEGEHAPAAAYFANDLAGTFRRHEPAIVAEWTKDNPGTRPSLWWEWCAPEPRKQLGGHGVRRREMFAACLPVYHCGIPSDWVEVDEADPPRFESQAAYLERHALLQADEAA